MPRGIYFDIVRFQTIDYSLLDSDPSLWTHSLPSLRTSLMLPRGVLAHFEVTEHLVLREVSIQTFANKDSITLFGAAPTNDLRMGDNRLLMFKLAENLPFTGWLDLGHENFNGPDQSALLRLHFQHGRFKKADDLTGAVVAGSAELSFQRDLAPDLEIYQAFCRSLQTDLDALAAEPSTEQRAVRTLNLIDRIENGHTWQPTHIRQAISVWVQQLHEPKTLESSMRALQLLAMVGHQITPVADYQPLINWIARNQNPSQRAGGIRVLQLADADRFAAQIAMLLSV